MKELIGSDKQIAWAKKLRETFENSHAKALSAAKKNKDTDIKSGDDSSFSDYAIKKLEEEREKLHNNDISSSASFWIDNRGSLKKTLRYGNEPKEKQYSAFSDEKHGAKLSNWLDNF